MSVYPVYLSKHNSKLEKQVIILMIPNGEGWYYLPVKKLPALSKGISSKHAGDIYRMNCLHSIRKKSNLNHLKKYAKIKIFVML